MGENVIVGIRDVEAGMTLRVRPDRGTSIFFLRDSEVDLAYL